MGAAYQQRETRESNTGVKLLSANRRALLRADLYTQGAGATGIPLPPHALTTLQSPIPPAIYGAVGISGGGPKGWPVVQNRRYKFSGSAIFTSGSPGDVSLESAGMFLFLLDAATGLPAGQLFNAARLSTTTALAQGVIMSFDEWDIDCNDLIQLSAQTAAVVRASSLAFVLYAQAVLNNTAGAPVGFTWQITVQADAAQFDSYRFTKWE